MRPSQLVRTALIVAAFAVMASLLSPGLAGAAVSTLRVGSLTLQRCSGARAWCGSLARPLDPARPSGPRIRIGLK